MNEKLRKKIVFAALGLAIIWAWFNIGNKKKATSADQYQVETIQPLSPTTASVVTAATRQGHIDTAAIASADWGNDPFQTSAKRSVRRYSSAPVLSWKLTGIMYSQNQPLAYINHKMVKTGDLVDNARVLKIDRDRVTLEHNNRTITLRVSRG